MAALSDIMSLPIKRLTAAAHLPKRGSDLAAGYDLCAAYDIVVAAHGKGIAKTDLAMAIPAVSGAAPSGAGAAPGAPTLTRDVGTGLLRPHRAPLRPGVEKAHRCRCGCY